MAAISRHGHITVNIKPDRNWFRARNGLQKLGEQIVGDRKIIFGNIVLRNLHNNDTRVGCWRWWWRGEKCARRQKFSGLKQPNVTRAGDDGEHANTEHKARDPWVAKCSSEPLHQTAYSQLPIIR